MKTKKKPYKKIWRCHAEICYVVKTYSQLSFDHMKKILPFALLLSLSACVNAGESEISDGVYVKPHSPRIDAETPVGQVLEQESIDKALKANAEALKRQIKSQKKRQEKVMDEIKLSLPPGREVKTEKLDDSPVRHGIHIPVKPSNDHMHGALHIPGG